MNSKQKSALLDPLFNDNPITAQVLGICSALAVTTKLETSVVMSIAVIAVMSLSNLTISLIRNLRLISLLLEFHYHPLHSFGSGSLHSCQCYLVERLWFVHCRIFLYVFRFFIHNFRYLLYCPYIHY